MPMVIPLVAAFAAGAGGVAALGAAATVVGVAGTIATVAAYATIAGAVLTGVGALTGSKGLMKIGAILSIGGGITSLATAAFSGVGAATSALDVGAADGAIAANGGSMAASTAGNAAADAGMALAEGATPSSLTGLQTGAPLSPVTPTTGMPVASSDVNLTPLNSAADGAGNVAMQEGATPASLTDQAMSAADPSAITPEAMSGAPNTATRAVTNAPSSTPALDKLSAAAGRTDSASMTSWFDKMRNVGGAVGEFMQKNPQLVKIGGDMLSSMYGPQAEKFDYEKSLMDRARSNLNNPVAMRYVKPNGAP